MKDDFISLKNDFAFRYTMKNEKVLRGFLAAVLKVDPNNITNILFQDPHLDKKAANEKQGILDVRVTINGSQQINVELQMSYFKYWTNRSLFYNLKMYTDQGERGNEYYDEFTPCIHIGILGFTPPDLDKEFYSKVQLLNTKTHKVYSDKITFHMIILKYIDQVPIEERDNLYYWAALIAAQSREEYAMLAKQNEYLKEAVKETEKINHDAALKREYLRRRMAIMDEATQKRSYYEDGHEDGLKEGREDGMGKLAKLIKCLAQDNEMDKIIEVSENTSLREELFHKYNIE